MSLDTAFEEGVEEGIEIGKVEGIEIGKVEAVNRVARRLILAGHDDAFIADVTGLTLAEIQKLRCELTNPPHYT